MSIPKAIKTHTKNYYTVKQTLKQSNNNPGMSMNSSRTGKDNKFWPWRMGVEGEWGNLWKIRLKHGSNISQHIPESPGDPCRSDRQVSNEITCLHMWESHSKVTYTNSSLNEFTNGGRVWSSVSEAIGSYTNTQTFTHTDLRQGVPKDNKRSMLGGPTVYLSSWGDRGHHQTWKLLAC